MDSPQIEDYRFGHIVIDGKSYDKDVIILPDRVRGGWWRKEGHALHPEDLDAVFEAAPEQLVVGQGAYSRMAVNPETKAALQEAGIEVIAADTEEACRRYNDLREQKNVAAALHLTC